jgi:hypothetical protein
VSVNGLAQCNPFRHRANSLLRVHDSLVYSPVVLELCVEVGLLVDPARGGFLSMSSAKLQVRHILFKSAVGGLIFLNNRLTICTV